MSPPPFCFGALTVCDASVAHASAIVTLLSVGDHLVHMCRFVRLMAACSSVVVASSVAVTGDLTSTEGQPVGSLAQLAAVQVAETYGLL